MHLRLKPVVARVVLAALLVILPGLAGAAGHEKVVILGFDGADAKLIEQYIEEGRLPNLKRLRDEGYYAQLKSTHPPQTPVSWASFTTGLNPGRTQIFDFLRRTEGTYLPEFAMIREGRRVLLFGDRNAIALGALGALVGGILAGAATLIVRRRMGPGLVAAGIGALLVGGPMAWMAGTWLPREIPTATNARQGTPFWTVAARAGIESRVLNVPATFPAEEQYGLTMLSGLGVPDMRGRIGSPSYFTSDEGLTLSINQFSVEIIRLEGRRGRIETSLVGPLNKPFFEYVVREGLRGIRDASARSERRAEIESDLEKRGIPRRLDVPFTLHVTDDDLTIDLSGRRETLRAGQWSDWFVVPIPVNPVVDTIAALKGIVRFKVLELTPEVRLYMSPLNFHPECQPVPFTSPLGFARQMLDRFGLFRTLGWPIDTWSMPSGLTDEAHFIEDMDSTVEKQVEMMKHFLDHGQERLYLQVFDFTDRVGHLLWRLHDPGHPLYDVELAEAYAGEIGKSYERMDRIVGDAMERISPGTALIICSDHGFTSFRRGVNYNTWLVENGFMSLRPGVHGGKTLEDLFDRGELGEFFKHVDWSRTKAYAMGLGNIYINLLGREPQGSVAPGREYDDVRDSIVRQLTDLVDPETGERPVTRVLRREEIYEGYDPRIMPDLRPANNEHYRVGWQTALGEVPPNVFEDNLKAWSGDHCSVDPDLVPGVLFSNVDLNRSDPWIGDIHPTVLGLLGLEPEKGLDGRSLLH
ncbi:MAG: alkaline phosphatase family protein [Acidobacteriota bacterium]